MFRGHNSQLVKLIEAKSEVWFQANEDEYGIEGYYNWDSLAAAYLVNPHFFKDQQQDCMVSVESLSRGELHSVNRDQTSYSPSKPYQQVRLNLPKIEDKSGLEQNMYQTWMNVEAELSRK